MALNERFKLSTLSMSDNQSRSTLLMPLFDRLRCGDVFLIYSCVRLCMESSKVRMRKETCSERKRVEKERR
jgi:hypothetical protein